MGFFDYLEELQLTSKILKNVNFWIVYFIVFIVILIFNYKISKNYGSKQSNFFSFILLLLGIILSGLSVIVPDYYNNMDNETFVYSNYKTYKGENFTDFSEKKNIKSDEKKELDELPILKDESYQEHKIDQKISQMVDNVPEQLVKGLDNTVKNKVKYILSSYDPDNDPYFNVECKKKKPCEWCSKEFESSYRGTSVKMSLWNLFDMWETYFDLSETYKGFNYDFSEDVQNYVSLIDKGILYECRDEVDHQRFCSKKCESENKRK